MNRFEDAVAKGIALDAAHRAGDPFAAAIRATRMAMLITDPAQADNPIIFANPAFLALTGYAHDEVIGRNCRFLQGADTDPAAVGALRAAIAGERDIHREILNYRKDGTAFWNALYLSPVKDGDGRVTYFFASLVDVTDKKFRELTARREKEDIAALVDERTTALRSALEAKTVLLHEVDHRVKNNLQLISALIRLQVRRIADQETKESLLGMLSRVEALGTVHRRLYQSDDVSLFDISEFARDLANDLVAASGRSPEVKVDLRLQTVMVPAAKAAPIALLVNELVTNCLKHAFGEAGPGTILVEIARMNHECRIVVEDDGAGMPAGELGPATFGRSLVEALTHQLRGRARWIVLGGTRVEVKLPVD